MGHRRTEANVFVVTVLVLVGTRVATSGGAVVAWPALWSSSLQSLVHSCEEAFNAFTSVAQCGAMYDGLG